MLIAGVDEVGRGPLAGPVVTAAVILPARYDLPGLDDSKKLSKLKRQKLSLAIQEQALAYAIGTASNIEIDQVNILQATMLAMQRAVAALAMVPDLVKVDGNRAPEFAMPAQAIIGGDGIEACISAASIIAKQKRDDLMAELALEFANYGWERNSGYPTKQHLAALKVYGVTPHHRRSFAPVAKLL